LTVETQIYSRPEILFAVPRDAFRPPPKVESAVVKLERITPEIEDVPSFLKFASMCFRHKRKTLRNNLLPVYELGGDEGRLRAEQMSVAQLAALYLKLRSIMVSQSAV
jgi:16S rRNA (adenine1518-N6/adenine1519-N6)-dimethyltransferase